MYNLDKSNCSEMVDDNKYVIISQVCIANTIM